MMPIFKSQNSYDIYLKEKEVKFQTFVHEFENTLSKFIKVDGIKLDYVNKIVRPKILVEGRREIRENKNSEPFFQGFAGIYKYMTYTLYWGTCCTNNNIHIKNVTLCDDYGKDILSIGSTGFNAGEIDILKPQNKFLIPKLDDLKVFSDHEFVVDLEDEIALISTNDDDNILANYIDINLEYDDERK